MHAVIDDFLRRYATSPIHVPRLERLLHAYSDGESEGAFAARFIEWDRACPNGEAARIVSEILSELIDDSGRLRRLNDNAVKGAIRWVAEGPGAMNERVALLRATLCSHDQAKVAHFTQWLEVAATRPATSSPEV